LVEAVRVDDAGPRLYKKIKCQRDNSLKRYQFRFPQSAVDECRHDETVALIALADIYLLQARNDEAASASKKAEAIGASMMHLSVAELRPL
jgi:hypothetical protein